MESGVIGERVPSRRSFQRCKETADNLAISELKGPSATQPNNRPQHRLSAVVYTKLTVIHHFGSGNAQLFFQFANGI